MRCEEVLTTCFEAGTSGLVLNRKQGKDKDRQNGTLEAAEEGRPLKNGPFKKPRPKDFPQNGKPRKEKLQKKETEIREWDSSSLSKEVGKIHGIDSGGEEQAPAEVNELVKYEDSLHETVSQTGKDVQSSGEFYKDQDPPSLRSSQRKHKGPFSHIQKWQDVKTDPSTDGETQRPQHSDCHIKDKAPSSIVVQGSQELREGEDNMRSNTLNQTVNLHAWRSDPIRGHRPGRRPMYKGHADWSKEFEPAKESKPPYSFNAKVSGLHPRLCFPSFSSVSGERALSDRREEDVERDLCSKSALLEEDSSSSSSSLLTESAPLGESVPTISVTVTTAPSAPNTSLVSSNSSIKSPVIADTASAASFFPQEVPDTENARLGSADTVLETSNQPALTSIASQSKDSLEDPTTADKTQIASTLAQKLRDAFVSSGSKAKTIVLVQKQPIQSSVLSESSSERGGESKASPPYHHQHHHHHHSQTVKRIIVKECSLPAAAAAPTNKSSHEASRGTHHSSYVKTVIIQKCPISNESAGLSSASSNPSCSEMPLAQSRALPLNHASSFASGPVRNVKNAMDDASLSEGNGGISLQKEQVGNCRSLVPADNSEKGLRSPVRPGVSLSKPVAGTPPPVLEKMVRTSPSPQRSSGKNDSGPATIKKRGNLFDNVFDSCPPPLLERMDDLTPAPPTHQAMSSDGTSLHMEKNGSSSLASNSYLTTQKKQKADEKEQHSSRKGNVLSSHSACLNSNATTSVNQNGEVESEQEGQGKEQILSPPSSICPPANTQGTVSVSGNASNATGAESEQEERSGVCLPSTSGCESIPPSSRSLKSGSVERSDGAATGAELAGGKELISSPGGNYQPVLFDHPYCQDAADLGPR
ncbi:hypothetical protein PoB_006426100 [Plakobranchus ocellatus]|uniref:Uncharacterized protein n=1 Tax=Plakobranchus ocellatus TaxID=259542 RepID=A0AAV4D193_9GAST|nr:hypothetical protein PoB_006426100 [Plakobranchus ocellatus]